MRRQQGTEVILYMNTVYSRGLRQTKLYAAAGSAAAAQTS